MRFSGAMTLTALVTVSLAAPLPVPKAGEIGKRDLMDVVDFIADNKPTIGISYQDVAVILRREGLLTSPSSDTAGKFIGKAFEKPKKTFPDNSGQCSPSEIVTDGPGRQVFLVASYDVDETQRIQLQGFQSPEAQHPQGPPLRPT